MKDAKSQEREQRHELLMQIPVNILESVKEVSQYLIEAEASHFAEWCDRPWCDPNDHIYTKAEEVIKYFCGIYDE